MSILRFLGLSLLVLSAWAGAACGGRSERAGSTGEDGRHRGGTSSTAGTSGAAGSAAGTYHSSGQGQGGDGGSDHVEPPEVGAAGDEPRVVVECPGGDAVSVSAAACGDGSLDEGEACDDGNAIAGDGCSSRCTVESGWSCYEPGTRCSPCGNCQLDGGEECDDGNSVDGDGCSRRCEAEPGFLCSGNFVCVWLGECGDGLVNVFSERCDDGNDSDGDGCSADCSTVEPGYVCRLPDVPCKLVSESYPHCGDGTVQPEYDEDCDEGLNQDEASECAAGCQFRRCGDGVLQPLIGETCDDGVNEGDYLGCSPDCQMPVASTSCTLGPTCGDGILQGNEQCDSGASGGPCGVDCAWGREGYCGDGVLEAAFEECDDGNTTSCDGCSSACLEERHL